MCHVGVAAAIVAPCRVSRVLSSHRMVPGPGGPSRERAAAYISKKDLAAKEEVSKQKKKKKKQEIIPAVKQKGDPVQR